MSRFVLTFEIWKTGNRMTELKFEAFLGRLRPTAIRCAEKISPTSHRKTNRVRLFKD